MRRQSFSSPKSHKNLHWLLYVCMCVYCWVIFSVVSTIVWRGVCDLFWCECQKVRRFNWARRLVCVGVSKGLINVHFQQRNIFFFFLQFILSSHLYKLLVGFETLFLSKVTTSIQPSWPRQKKGHKYTKKIRKSFNYIFTCIILIIQSVPKESFFLSGSIRKGVPFTEKMLFLY